MSAAGGQWLVRGEDGVGEGRPIALERIQQAVADGIWSESDQVRGPDDADWALIGNHPQLEEHVPSKPLLGDDLGEEAQMDMTPMIDVTFS